jgi:hypothetical protein
MSIIFYTFFTEKASAKLEKFPALSVSKISL